MPGEKYASSLSSMKWLSEWICKLQTHLPLVSGLSSSAEAERKHCSSNNELQARAPLSGCLESVPRSSCQMCWPRKLSGISVSQLIRVVSCPFHRLEELKGGRTRSSAFIRLCALQHRPRAACACSARALGTPLLLRGGVWCQKVAHESRFWGTWSQEASWATPWCCTRCGPVPCEAAR